MFDHLDYLSLHCQVCDTPDIDLHQVEFACADHSPLVIKAVLGR